MLKTHHEKVLDFAALGTEGPEKRHRRRRRRESSKMEKTVAEVHKSETAKVHTSARRNRSQSRHERHKCHKHRQKEENELVTQLKANHLLNRRLNASMSSIDSGLPTTEGLPPFEIDVKKAYQHVKLENSQLMEDLKGCRIECSELRSLLETAASENSSLKDDVGMLKNLVYRLNVELEKCQDVRDKIRSADGKKQPYELPKYYHTNFLKPILPLLRAYTETIQEKNETIESLERNFEKFNANFNEILKENETLYKELEIKLTRGDDSLIDEVKMLRNELTILKEEKELFESQAKIEAEKLQEVQAVYQRKVTLLEKERDGITETLQETRENLFTLQGKHSVVKHELERLRSEEETKVPLTVHSASIAECKRLFQSLKDDHESEKHELLYRLKELESQLARKEDELRKNEQERLNLEQGNFDLVFECDNLRQRVVQLEKSRREETEEGQLKEIQEQLTNALKRNTDLELKLHKMKKKLQHSMTFAEDLVREQEGLLGQLHEKQRENAAMTSHFGSLKKQLKIVEKGASAGLDSVEQTIRALREENTDLTSEVRRLKEFIREKEHGALETEETSS